MKMNIILIRNILSILFLLLNIHAFSQEDTNRVIEKKIISIEKCYDLSNINGTLIDSLTKPKTFIFDNEEVVTFAIFNDSVYSIFSIRNWDYMSGKFDHFEQVDFDSLGSKEIVLFFKLSHGISYATSGHEERYCSFYLIDIDSHALILREDYYDFYANWHDEGDSTIMSVDCSCYEVEFSYKKILMKPIDGEGIPVNEPKIEYLLRNGKIYKTLK